MRELLYEYFLLLMQVDNLRKHVHASGLSKRIDLVITSPLIRYWCRHFVVLLITVCLYLVACLCFNPETVRPTSVGFLSHMHFWSDWAECFYFNWSMVILAEGSWKFFSLELKYKHLSWFHSLFLIGFVCVINDAATAGRTALILTFGHWLHRQS